MALQHPTPELLDQYLINHLSEPDSAELERHVYACGECFSRVAASDLEMLALAKACSMLAQLESDGTRVLSLTIPESAPKPVVLPAPTWRSVQPRYTAIAAGLVAAAVAFSWIGSVQAPVSHPTVALVDVPQEVRSEPADSADMAQATESMRVNTSAERRPRFRAPQPYIVYAKYTKPFIPPDRDVEAPEFDMSPVPPPVLARLEQPHWILRLPELPKKKLSGSQRVLRALASPFRKLGGLFAPVVMERSETYSRRTAGI
jgi:hypothetical protein